MMYERDGPVMSAFYNDYSIYDGVRDAVLISGHIKYGEMATRFPDATFVTWLRSPVDRVISQYKSWRDPANFQEHWRRNAPKDESVEHITIAQNASFEDFVFSTNESIKRGVTNVQTSFLQSQPGAWRENGLRSAMHNIERNIRCFGLVERFEASIDAFCAEFGWTTRFEHHEEAANRSKPGPVEISERALQRVMDLNAEDVTLYEFASGLFDERLAALGFSAAHLER